MLRWLKHYIDEILYGIYYKFNMNIISIAFHIKIRRDLMKINVQQLLTKYHFLNIF